MKISCLFFSAIFLAFLINAAAQQGVISQENAISGLNDLLQEKKIAVDVIDTVDSSGKTGKFTRIITDDAETATRLKRNLGQRPSIYFDKAGNRFVGPGQAAGSKIARADLVENGGRAVADYWKLQEQAGKNASRLSELTARKNHLNRNLVPSLEKELQHTTGWHPFKKSRLNKQIAQAKAEVSKIDSEAKKLRQVSKDFQSATKTLFSDASKTGKSLSRTQRLWSWFKATKAAKSTGKLSGWKLARLGKTAAAIGATKNGAKWVVGKTVGKVLLPLGIAYDTVAILAPYTSLLSDTVGPQLAVTADFGSNDEAIVVSDDGTTRVFFGTTIYPNSELNIRKVEAYRDAFAEGADSTTISKYGQYVGLGAHDVYGWIADWGDTDDEDQFIVGCNLELWGFDKSTRKRTTLVADTGFPECVSGSTPNLEWEIPQKIEPGTYQLVLRAIFNPEIIVFSRDEIKSREHLFSDILSTETVETISDEARRAELSGAGLTEEEIAQTIADSKKFTDDPLIWNILNFGMPAKTLPITYDGQVFDFDSESYKVSHLSIHSKESLEEKNQFDQTEINDIQVWFDFAHAVDGYILTVYKTDDSENYEIIAFEDQATGPFPNGNPALKKQEIALYVFDNETSPENFNGLANFVSDDGDYVIGLKVAYYNDEGEQFPHEEDAASAPLIIGEGGAETEGPITGETTTGYAIFRISNRQQIEEAGVSLSDYVLGLEIKRGGELISSFGNPEEAKRIYLQEDYLIINNITKSNEEEVVYGIEWSRTGYKKGKGGFTMEIDDPEVIEGVWKEGDKIE